MKKWHKILLILLFAMMILYDLIVVFSEDATFQVVILGLTLFLGIILCKMLPNENK